MDFRLDDIHDDLAASVDALLAKADIPAATGAWTAGDRGPADAILTQLADVGVCGLLIDEAHGGAGVGAMEVVVVAEALGRHAMPGPLVESLAVVPALLAGVNGADRLSALTAGRWVSCAVPQLAPRAADATLADEVLLVAEGTLSVGTVGAAQTTVDPSRTVAAVEPDTSLGELPDSVVATACQLGAVATAAQLLGLGQSMLTLAADYAQARKQFGRAIGSFQAVKHHLADVAIALEMARPLVWAAALGIDGRTPDSADVPREVAVARDVSAAKVAAADAADLAARTSLQVLGAIGYTAEHELSRYLTKTRALVTAWGTPAYHRSALLDSLQESDR